MYAPHWYENPLRVMAKLTDWVTSLTITSTHQSIIAAEQPIYTRLQSFNKTSQLYRRGGFIPSLPNKIPVIRDKINKHTYNSATVCLSAITVK